MRWGLLGIVSAIAAMLSSMALAQGSDENWEKCKGDTPELVIAGCTAVIQSGKEENANLAIAYYYRGAAYDGRGFYDRAIQDYDQAITLYPKYASAFNKRGYAYWALFKIDRAIEDFDQAIALNPKFAQAFNNRGNAYRVKADYDRAIKDFDQALALLPKFPEAFGNRGICYQAKGEYQRAIQDYDQSIALDNKIPRVFYDRGTAYEAMGQHDDAIKNYDQAITLDPKYAHAFAERGNAYQNKGAFARAIEDYDQAAKLDSHNAQTFTSRGRAKFGAAQYAAAVGDFEQSLTLNPAQPYTVLWLHLAHARAKTDDTAELKKYTAKINLKSWPGPIIAFYMKQQTAQQVTAAAATGDPKTQSEQSCEAAFYLGEDELLRRNESEALRLLKQARDTCPPSFIEYDAAGFELKYLAK
jgi:lipoprotein NlpI